MPHVNRDTGVSPDYFEKRRQPALSTWLQVGMHLIAQDAKKIE